MSYSSLKVIYYFESSAGFHLLDGDRIATLVAGHLQQLLAEAGLTDLVKSLLLKNTCLTHTWFQIQPGLVQTAYANGSSTSYITNELGVPVAFTPTGVKHLHHRAVQFPIGVYFEANGHGTVVFDEKTQQLIRSKGGAKLNALMDVINQTVGDAISDMLLVECVLADRDWDCDQWFNCYKDLPNRFESLGLKLKAL